MVTPEPSQLATASEHSNDRWNETNNLIERAQRIVCSTHVNPDGDGLGSQLALYSFLKDLGKQCRILNPSPLPEEYHFLSDYSDFAAYDQTAHRSWLKEADLAIILDIGAFSRLETLGEDLKTFRIPILSIDHHPHLSPDGFVHFIHDVTACATGYLVHEYIKYVNHRLGRSNGLKTEIAIGLYVAIMTDTGSFRFSNTSAETHEMAGELIRGGVNPSEIYERVYESSPVERIRLMVAALETVQVEGDGHLAWFVVTRRMMAETGSKPEHAAGFTDTVRSIRGVEVAVMIREVSDRQCKVNFRSKGRVRIGGLARRLGGGGHAFAAGATVDLPLEQAVDRVVSSSLSEIKSQFQEDAGP